MTILWGSPAIRSQVSSFRGKGAAVGKGTPHPVPKTKTLIGVCGATGIDKSLLELGTY
jgi:hypothetical protein